MNLLAQKAGTSHGYVSQLEAGKIPSPGMEKLSQLAEVLDVRLSELTGELDDGSGENQRPATLDPEIIGLEINLLAIKEFDPEEYDLIMAQILARVEKLRRDSEEERRAKRSKRQSSKGLGQSDPAEPAS